jgi:hypothetical protein
MKVYYTHCTPAASFGHSYGREWKMAEWPKHAASIYKVYDILSYTYVHLSVLVSYLVTNSLYISHFSAPAATENKRRPVEVLLTQYSSMCILKNVSYISTAKHVGSFFNNIYSQNYTTVKDISIINE